MQTSDSLSTRARAGSGAMAPWSATGSSTYRPTTGDSLALHASYQVAPRDMAAASNSRQLGSSMERVRPVASGRAAPTRVEGLLHASSLPTKRSAARSQSPVRSYANPGQSLMKPRTFSRGGLESRGGWSLYEGITDDDLRYLDFGSSEHSGGRTANSEVVAQAEVLTNMALLAQAKAERLYRAKQQVQSDTAADGSFAPSDATRAGLRIVAPSASGRASGSPLPVGMQGTPSGGRTEHELGWYASPNPAGSHRVARYELETPKPGAEGRRQRARRRWSFGVGQTMRMQKAIDAMKAMAQSKGIETEHLGSTPKRAYVDQGDPTAYSVESILKRQELKQSTRIQGAVGKFWQLLATKWQGEVKVYRPAYVRCTMLFFRVLHPRATFREALECVEDDWLRDAGARKPGLTKKEYFDSLFQLADTWCESLEEDEYVAFLDMLYDRVTEPKVGSPRGRGMRGSPSPTPRGGTSRSPVFGAMKSTRSGGLSTRGGIGHSQSFNFGRQGGAALARMSDTAKGATGASGLPLFSTMEQPVGGQDMQEGYGSMGRQLCDFRSVKFAGQEVIDRIHEAGNTGAAARGSPLGGGGRSTPTSRSGRLTPHEKETYADRQKLEHQRRLAAVVEKESPRKRAMRERRLSIPLTDHVLEAARQAAVEARSKPPPSREGTPGDPFMKPPPRSVLGQRPPIGATQGGGEVPYDKKQDAVGAALAHKGSLGDMLEILRQKREEEEARAKDAAKAAYKRKKLREKRQTTYGNGEGGGGDARIDAGDEHVELDDGLKEGVVDDRASSSGNTREKPKSSGSAARNYSLSKRSGRSEKQRGVSSSSQTTAAKEADATPTKGSSGEVAAWGAGGSASSVSTLHAHAGLPTTNSKAVKDPSPDGSNQPVGTHYVIDTYQYGSQVRQTLPTRQLDHSEPTSGSHTSRGSGDIAPTANDGRPTHESTDTGKPQPGPSSTRYTGVSRSIGDSQHIHGGPKSDLRVGNTREDAGPAAAGTYKSNEHGVVSFGFSDGQDSHGSGDRIRRPGGSGQVSEPIYPRIYHGSSARQQAERDERSGRYTEIGESGGVHEYPASSQRAAGGFVPHGNRQMLPRSPRETTYTPVGLYLAGRGSARAAGYGSQQQSPLHHYEDGSGNSPVMGSGSLASAVAGARRAQLGGASTGEGLGLASIGSPMVRPRVPKLDLGGSRRPRRVIKQDAPVSARGGGWHNAAAGSRPGGRERLARRAKDPRLGLMPPGSTIVQAGSQSARKPAKGSTFARRGRRLVDRGAASIPSGTRSMPNSARSLGSGARGNASHTGGKGTYGGSNRYPERHVRSMQAAGLSPRAVALRQAAGTRLGAASGWDDGAVGASSDALDSEYYFGAPGTAIDGVDSVRGSKRFQGSSSVLGTQRGVRGGGGQMEHVYEDIGSAGGYKSFSEVFVGDEYHHGEVGIESNEPSYPDLRGGIESYPPVPPSSQSPSKQSPSAAKRQAGLLGSQRGGHFPGTSVSTTSPRGARGVEEGVGPEYAYPDDIDGSPSMRTSSVSPGAYIIAPKYPAGPEALGNTGGHSYRPRQYEASPPRMAHFAPDQGAAETKGTGALLAQNAGPATALQQGSGPEPTKDSSHWHVRDYTLMREADSRGKPRGWDLQKSAESLHAASAYGIAQELGPNAAAHVSSAVGVGTTFFAGRQARLGLYDEPAISLPMGTLRGLDESAHMQRRRQLYASQLAIRALEAYRGSTSATGPSLTLGSVAGYRAVEGLLRPEIGAASAQRLPPGARASQISISTRKRGTEYVQTQKFSSDAYGEQPIGVIGSYYAGIRTQSGLVVKSRSVRAQMEAYRYRYEAKLAADKEHAAAAAFGAAARSRPRFAERYMEGLAQTAVDAGAPKGPFAGVVQQGGDGSKGSKVGQVGSAIDTSSEADRRRRIARQRKLPGTSVFPDPEPIDECATFEIYG